MSRPREMDLPPGAFARHVVSRPANAVIYALVVALLDLEQRRDRGKVRRPMARNAER
jgi:hypothetical protein